MVDSRVLLFIHWLKFKIMPIWILFDNACTGLSFFACTFWWVHRMSRSIRKLLTWKLFCTSKLKCVNVIVNDSCLNYVVAKSIDQLLRQALGAANRRLDRLAIRANGHERSLGTFLDGLGARFRLLLILGPWARFQNFISMARRKTILERHNYLL